MKMKTFSVALFLSCVGLLVSGCLGGQKTDTDLTLMQETITILKEEQIKNQQDLLTITDPDDRATMLAINEKLTKQIAIFEEAFLNAKDISDAKWTTGEAVIGMVGTFFPPILLALPWIRTLRRQRTAIFDSIKAGGGPANRPRARSVLMENPAARKAYIRWKNGAEL